jgi:hypothetical protein
LCFIGHCIVCPSIRLCFGIIFLCLIDHCIVCPSIQLCFGIIFCALLTIVLSVPLYGYVLVSFFVLYLPLYYLSLYTLCFGIIVCALLAIVLSVPLYGYVYSFGIFKLFYHFVVYLLFIYKLYIPDHAYMFHNEYKTCLAKLLYMYLFSICKAYFHQTQFTRLS